MAPYGRLADAVVIVHSSVVVFVVAGALAASWQPWLAWVHISIMLSIATIYLLGVTCPLTALENRFRRAGGQPGYDGSFLGHYLAGAIHPRHWERSEPWVGATVLLGNLAVYGFLASNIGGG
jgi:hypothetical protein